jgi:hypothetical protein
VGFDYNVSVKVKYPFDLDDCVQVEKGFMTRETIVSDSAPSS